MSEISTRQKSGSPGVVRILEPRKLGTFRIKSTTAGTYNFNIEHSVGNNEQYETTGEFVVNSDPAVPDPATPVPTLTLDCPEVAYDEELITCSLVLNGLVTQPLFSGTLTVGNGFRQGSVQITPSPGVVLAQRPDARTGAFQLTLESGRRWANAVIAEIAMRRISGGNGLNEVALRYSVNGNAEVRVIYSIRL